MLVLLSACGTPQIVTTQQAQIDSLYVMNSNLRDSLAFYESIDSGSYYRDLRVRDAAVNRLEYSLSICYDGGLLLATEQVDELFKPASADLLESGKVRLDTLAVGLTAAIGEKGILRIEAHADNIAPGPSIKEKYPSNWELSAARAAAVAQYLIASHGLVSRNVEVVTYGDTRPLYDNRTSQGRQLNRRIEFSILSEATVDNSSGKTSSSLLN